MSRYVVEVEVNTEEGRTYKLDWDRLFKSYQGAADALDACKKEVVISIEDVDLNNSCPDWREKIQD